MSNLKTKIISNYGKIKPIKTGFVVCGDIHLYNTLPFSTYSSEKISNRLYDIEQVLIDTIYCACNLKLPLIINGDLITGRRLGYPVIKVLSDISDRIKELKVTTYLNLGNHDKDGSTTMLLPLLRDNKYITTIIDPVTMPLGKNLACTFVPFNSLARVKVQLKKIATRSSQQAAKRPKYNVLACHMPVKGAHFTGATSDSGLIQKMFYKTGIVGKHFDLVVASHFHKYQAIAKGHGFYTGSLVPVNFGEQEKEHGYHIVDLVNKQRYFVCPPTIAQFKEVKDVKAKSFKYVKGNYIKVKVTDKNFTLSDEKKLRAVLIKKGARAVVFNKLSTYEATTNIEVQPDFTVEEFVSVYAETLGREEELDTDKLRALGLRILNDAQERRTLSARLSDV